MQYPSDTELAAVIESAVRHLSVDVRVDWARDGNYAHAYSNLSSLVKSAKVDRELHGAMPDEVAMVGGFSTSKLVLQLGGKRSGDTMDAVRAFTPYNYNSSLYGLPLAGAHIRYDIVVRKPTNENFLIRQFSGRVSKIRLDRKAGTVTIECLDLAEALRNPISLPVWAVADSTQNYLSDADPMSSLLAERYGVRSSHVIDLVLRKAGGGVGPRMNTGCVFSCTFNGGTIPETGDLKSTGTRASFADTGFWGTPFVDGPTGVDVLACAPMPAGYNTIDTNTHVKGYANAPVNMAGSAAPVGGVRTLALGGWFKADAALNPNTVNNNSIMFALGETFTFGDNQVQMFSDQLSGGTMSMRLNVDMGAWTGTWRTAYLSAGWHYIAFMIESRSSGVTVYQNVDGVISLASVYVAPSAGALPAVTQSTRSGQNYVEMVATTTCTHLQVWTQDVPAASMTYNRYHPTPSFVDEGLNTLTYLPDIYERSAWSVLEELVKAEYGVIVAGEDGRVQFLNHLTARSAAGSPVRTLGTNVVEDLNLQVNLQSVLNTINYGYKPGGFRVASVWSAPTKEALDTNNGVTRSIQFPMTDTMFVYHGDPGQISNDKSVAPENWADVGGWAVTDPLDPAWNNWTANSVFSSVFPIAYLNNRFVQININNASGRNVRFAFSDQFSPAYSIKGHKIFKYDTVNTSVTDEESVTKYDQRTLAVSQSAYHQHPAWVEFIMSTILSEMVRPIPTMDKITIPGDPRIQLRDSFQVEDPEGIGEALVVSVVGITRTFNADTGLTDQYRLELLTPAGVWILGHPVYGRLGITTIV